jgi:hypothetical protein
MVLVRSLVAIALTLACVCSASADETLPARELRFPPFAVSGVTLVNFDIYDINQELHAPTRVVYENMGQSIFVKKKHLGIAAGDDNGILHTAVGFYLTIAEWKRLNFGLPALELGIGRYKEYDAVRDRVYEKSKPTIILSIASIHYRAGYIRALGLNWYINFEQVQDLRERMMGSQLGISFSRK